MPTTARLESWLTEGAVSAYRFIVDKLWRLAYRFDGKQKLLSWGCPR
jgi:hypothetical protein